MATPSTVNVWNLNGVLREFDITFDYLSRTFIKVTLLGPGGVQPLVQNTDYTFVTNTRIRLVNVYGPPTWDQVEIRRETSTTERLVEFQDASILHAIDLNTADIQVMHVAEEARNAATETIAINNDGNLDARGRKIVNLAAGSDDGDAMNLGQYRADVQSAVNQANRAEQEANRATTQADRAKTEADRSDTRANASNTSANLSQAWANTAKNTNVPGAAADSRSSLHYSEVSKDEAATATAQRLLASQWAQHPENVSIPGQPAGSYSSLHYSLKATASAAAAAASAGAASTSAGNAATSVTQAADEVTKAQAEVTKAQAEVAKAKAWASQTPGAVEGGEFSAKYWAQQAALGVIPEGSVGASKRPIEDQFNMIPDSEFADNAAWFSGIGGYTVIDGTDATRSYKQRRFVAATSSLGEVTNGTPNAFHGDSYSKHIPVVPGKQYDFGCGVLVDAGSEGILQVSLLMIGYSNANLGQAVIGTNVDLATPGRADRRALWTCPDNVVTVRLRFRLQLSTTGTMKGSFSVFNPFGRKAVELGQLAADVTSNLSAKDTKILALENRAFQPKAVALPTGTDANTLKTSGIYDLTSVVNGPPGYAATAWWFLEVMAHSNDPNSYVHQRWTRLEGGDNDQPVFDRCCTGGVWTKYRRFMMNGDLGSVYLNFGPQSMDASVPTRQWIMHRQDGIMRLGGEIMLPNNQPMSVAFNQTFDYVMSAGATFIGPRAGPGTAEANSVITDLQTSYIQIHSGQQHTPGRFMWWVEGFRAPR